MGIGNFATEQEPMTRYLITFTDAADRPLGELVTSQESRMDACKFGWDNAPAGTDDFQVLDETEFLRLTGAVLDPV